MTLMDVLLALRSILDDPWTIPLSIMFILLILETERNWVRARRKRGFRYSPLSHLFDALITLLGLITIASITRAVLHATLVSFTTLLAPFAWVIGLMLILGIGIGLIRRFAPVPDSPSRTTHQ